MSRRRLSLLALAAIASCRQTEARPAPGPPDEAPAAPPGVADPAQPPGASPPKPPAGGPKAPPPPSTPDAAPPPPPAPPGPLPPGPPPPPPPPGPPTPGPPPPGPPAPPPPPGPPPPPSPPTPSPPPTGPTASDELFAPDRLPRFDLEVTPAAIAELNAAELAGDLKHYVRARFRYGSEVLEDVGIRIKGEATRTAFAAKPALKIKFDAFVLGRSFRGLRRLTLNNLMEDPSGIAERLAYDFFRLAGLPASRANNALLWVNGQFYGVYANVESIDKPLLRRWFASDAGNLYEEGGEDLLPGREATFELQTNELADDRNDLRALTAALARAGDATLLQELAPLLDTERFLRFTAAEGIVNQWDMYGYTRFYPNNFHLYRDPASGRFVFLPWGLDMAWKPFDDTAVHLPMLDLAHSGNSPLEPITAGLVLRRCLASPPCRARYLAVVREVVALLPAAGLDARASSYRAQIAPHLAADWRKVYSDAETEASFAAVLAILRARAARVLADLGN